MNSVIEKNYFLTRPGWVFYSNTPNDPTALFSPSSSKKGAGMVVQLSGYAIVPLERYGETVVSPLKMREEGATE